MHNYAHTCSTRVSSVAVLFEFFKKVNTSMHTLQRIPKGVDSFRLVYTLRSIVLYAKRIKSQLKSISTCTHMIVYIMLTDVCVHKYVGKPRE